MTLHTPATPLITPSPPPTPNQSMPSRLRFYPSAMSAWSVLCTLNRDLIHQGYITWEPLVLLAVPCSCSALLGGSCCTDCHYQSIKCDITNFVIQYHFICSLCACSLLMVSWECVGVGKGKTMSSIPLTCSFSHEGGSPHHTDPLTPPNNVM